jgi:hypothetical protein
MIACAFHTARAPVDARVFYALRQPGIQQNMVETKAAIPFPTVPHVVPECVHRFSGMQRPDGISPALREKMLIGGAALGLQRSIPEADLFSLVDRVTIKSAAIQIQLSEAAEAGAAATTLTFPWTPPSPYRKREIIQGIAEGKTSARPMRASARAILIEALRDTHRWLDGLLTDPLQTPGSLAFLDPEIVKATVYGRLPRGYGLKRLVDLPIAWPDQWRALELEEPAMTSAGRA